MHCIASQKTTKYGYRIAIHSIGEVRLPAQTFLYLYKYTTLAYAYKMQIGRSGQAGEKGGRQ